MKKAFIVSSVIVGSAFLARKSDLFFAKDAPKVTKGSAFLHGEGSCHGRVEIRQISEDSMAIIEGKIFGLTPGLHGMHIHDQGDISNGIESSGPHYNPHNAPHGGPSTLIRHVGDLGNINADADGIAEFKISEKGIGLHGIDSIIGRTLSITKNQDDLGLGKHPDSRINGNTGESAAWGVIGIKK